MRKRSLYRVIILGIVAISASLAVQGYYLWSAYTLRTLEFHQQVQVALLGVAEGFEEINQTLIPDIALINRITNNYYVVNLNAVIDAGVLEFLLQRELENVGIYEDFEYGIYDCYTDKMVYGNYVSYAPTSDTTAVNSTTIATRTELPTYDEYIYYFGVRFPKHQTLALNSFGPIGVLGTVMLITMMFFAYASWVMVRQQKLSEMQKDFINNMTHEFKTPLSTIKVASSVLNRSEAVQEDKRLARYAGIIEDQNERLTTQVEKILQLAKIERGRFKLQLEPYELNELILDSVSGTQANVEEAGGNLTLKLQADDRGVQVDRLHFTSALSALLDNAIKYSPEAPVLTVTTTPTEQGTRIEIADEGIGIPKEHQTRIFEKFYRVPTGNVHDVKGFGLGLFYVVGVCEAHGFELSLDSARTKGSAFRIDIPLQQRSSGNSLWQKLKNKFFKPSNSSA